MKIYEFDMEYENVCPKCKSKHVIKRFLNYEDTEDYRLHYDTLKCSNCGFWDFPDAFYTLAMTSDKTEKCPKCVAIGKADIYSHDFYSGTIELECECGHIDDIENFVGVDRWNEFKENEKKKHASELKFYEELDEW